MKDRYESPEEEIRRLRNEDELRARQQAEREEDKRVAEAQRRLEAR